mmetsp:Transcript_13069/g.35596  ORF Transcript_13069/g.35596 Transcript_13069/m.35596 type:complete len:253 (+) Transcript_13069:1486-2244(+)
MARRQPYAAMPAWSSSSSSLLSDSVLYLAKAAANCFTISPAYGLISGPNLSTKASRLNTRSSASSSPMSWKIEFRSTGRTGFKDSTSSAASMIWRSDTTASTRTGSSGSPSSATTLWKNMLKVGPWHFPSGNCTSMYCPMTQAALARRWPYVELRQGATREASMPPSSCLYGFFSFRMSPMTPIAKRAPSARRARSTGTPALLVAAAVAMYCCISATMAAMNLSRCVRRLAHRSCAKLATEVFGENISSRMS